MKQFHFIRDNKKIRAIAHSQDEAMYRLHTCFTNRHGKIDAILPMEYIDCNDVDRQDFHFYSKSQANRKAADRFRKQERYERKTKR